MTRQTTGSCLCGVVRFEAEGEPLWIAHCHCHSCRRHTGSVLATYVGMAKDRFRYTQGTPGTYASSPGVTRSFCASCGTPLAYETERLPEEIHLYISTLENPEDFTPVRHVFFSERIPWFDTADDLPRHPETSGRTA